MVELWRFIFDGVLDLIPWLRENVKVESDKDELRENLRGLFLEKARELIEGGAVKKCERKLGNLVDEIKGVSRMLAKGLQIGVANAVWGRKEGLLREKEVVVKRLAEFRKGMRCVIEHLEGKDEEGFEEGVRVIRFEREFNWSRLWRIMKRECARLDDGLPIYAYRSEILNDIHRQQIMVLIGETGSGKSTQLVQFLADSGVATSESVICTQPRKLAAMSLTQRVEEESHGCYQDSSVTCSLSYSSARRLSSKIIFMTDHCLLQQYLNDKKLSGISCIIVDEAHERSLNTDILLAVLKNLLRQRTDLRLVIMSATADAQQLADYFYGCRTFHVSGRTFPVDIKYVSREHGDVSNSGVIASYVYDVMSVVTEIHKTEEEGAILAFLTSQTEVEWVCDRFTASSAICLPLHGKLSHEDQRRVFQDYPGKRKVIFATNVAETSLTIPGVKYVVDSGMVKESRFEPSSGMNLLRVCRVSQSSANQRAGRAGRTEPGNCYRIYSEMDYQSMEIHHEPEICRVHLGVAVLRILALGVKNVKDFDFVDAPHTEAIEMAIKNLIQLGAVTMKNDAYELTREGRDLVKLGIEPRLGKMVLQSFGHRLGREGLILAAVMANSSSIFCRIGSEQEKQKSDRLKVQFCHPNGDLFTLLAVYKAWEDVPKEQKNSWCWSNSINAKSMRRCSEMVHDLESCLQNDLNIIIPSYWRWNPQMLSENDGILKRVILSALAENVAVYSGYDQLGYEVVLSGKHVQLHPSCTLLSFGQRPEWVVFGDILSVPTEYMVCVTAVDSKHFPSLCPPLLFDFSKKDQEKLQKIPLTGFGTMLLKRFCGKSNSYLHNLVSYVRAECMDKRIGIEVNVDDNMVVLYASSQHVDKVFRIVKESLDFEHKLLNQECIDKYLFNAAGSAAAPPVALFGPGAQIKHLELHKRCLSVDIFHPSLSSIDDKKLLMFLEQYSKGIICGVHKLSGQDNEENDKWGRVTFLSPDAAQKVADLSVVDYNGAPLKVLASRIALGSDHKLFSVPPLKAKVSWPRMPSKGVAIVKCDPNDVPFMLDDFSNLVIGGRSVRCEASLNYDDSIRVAGLDKELTEADIFDVLSISTNRKILDAFIIRGHTTIEQHPSHPSHIICEEALLRELFSIMPKRNHQANCVRVQVFSPQPKDATMRAVITFDGNLHLEAAKALELIEGKVLPCCLPWQKMKCHQLFHSSVSCPAPAYYAIKDQLNSLLASAKRRRGVECSLEKNENGSYRVKISANATKTVAEVRMPFERLMRGKLISQTSISASVLQNLFSWDGTMLIKSIQRETGAYILFDRHNLVVRIFGPSDRIDMAEQKFVRCITDLHERKQLKIYLRGGSCPSDLMKRVVQKFGPDLHGLKKLIPVADFSLNTKHHFISIDGARDVKQQVEEIIFEIAETSGHPSERIDDDNSCPICLCEVEDPYMLEGCTHKFCRSCLLEQCDSAIRTREGFPMVCTHQGCGVPFLLADLKSLLTAEKLEDLFRASLGAFVAGSGGTYRFCPSPDCPSVYCVTDLGDIGDQFICGACYTETCTRCHLEYHPYLSCERYKEFKDEDPEYHSLHKWSLGKDNVKKCPGCKFTIEKIEGCNHMECKCGRHVCWVCLEIFDNSSDCYQHLRSVHQDDI
ncbi:RNA helicase [Lithospermum erythrorhizon]|uniref:RNA helicase n=1 Tax=Lithospermum erythrorhizon TaxID=34254 RepID=A0AAV3RW25_LITER